MPKAYPIYDAEYRGHLDAVRGVHRPDREPAHWSAQRHAQVQQPGPLDADAMFAVENMQGASHDLWAVNTDFEYHEEQRLDEPQPGAPRRVGRP
jgi:hypothetical protein